MRLEVLTRDKVRKAAKKRARVEADRVEELPEENRKDWEWIIKEVTKCGPLSDSEGNVWRGSVENTMKTVRNSTASKIAKKFYQLYWAVSENKPYT